jgi:hypothetical protein
MDDPLQLDLRQALAGLTVCAWRLHLDTPGVLATVPLLRGVWGNALREVDLALYQRLFEGAPGGTPRYVMRPAPAAVTPAPALDFLLFGMPDGAAEAAVWAAWEMALQRGLGPDRQAARLLEVCPLAWDGTALTPARCQPGFALAPLPWPAGGPGCRLVFPAPVRLLRDGRLLGQPTLADLAIAALRRVQALGPEAAAAVWERRRDWLDRTWMVKAAPFQGAPLDLVRYSGRQRSEIELRGVVGELFLPEGPGPMADLLLAATWLHLGKGTVMGMGQVVIEPLRPSPGG